MSDLGEASLNQLIEAFCGQEREDATEAFGELAQRIRRGLFSYYYSSAMPSALKEDIAEEVIRRLWTNRANIENRGSAAWWNLVKKMADQVRVDILRKEGHQVSLEEFEYDEVPDSEVPAVHVLLEKLEDRLGFYRAADELFLGLNREESEEDRARRILAAYLFYREGLSWQAVCDVLNRRQPQTPVTRQTLDAWFQSEQTILELAFRTLYVCNDHLASQILGIPTASEEELNQIHQQAMLPSEGDSGLNGWTWAEVRAILWRYRDADRINRILTHEHCKLDKEELFRVFDRCLDHFPFTSIMKGLILELATWPPARKTLTNPGLWHRLVLEYHCNDTTRHRDILDRTSPAAAEVPCKLTNGMLNVWLSNGRLFMKLASYIKHREEGL